MKILTGQTEILVENGEFSADFGKQMGFGRFSACLFSHSATPIWVHICLGFFGLPVTFFSWFSPSPWQVNLDLTSLLDGEDKKSKNKRGVLPKHATNIMRSWLFQHLMVSIVATDAPCRAHSGGCTRGKRLLCRKEKNLENERTEVVVCLSLGYLKAQSGFAFILGAFGVWVFSLQVAKLWPWCLANKTRGRDKPNVWLSSMFADVWRSVLYS